MNNFTKKIILASASPRRKELLSQIGVKFEIIVSDAEEITEASEPSQVVMDLSKLKATDIFIKLTEEEKRQSLVIGADTVVSLEGQIMGKPGNAENAVRMLSSLQGKTHQVYTGVTLVYWEESSDICRCQSFFEKTDVSLYPMTEDEIEAYVATGEPMDKAGGYAIQGKCAIHVKEICGDYSNVVGLPIGRLYQEMKNTFSGFEIWEDTKE